MANKKHEWKPSTVLKVGRVSKTLNDWATDLHCPVQTILGRLERGWAADKAVHTKISGVGGSTRGKRMAAETLTPDECQRILDKCNDGATGIRNRALIVIGWRSGLRISEVLDLEPHNIDLQAQTIRVLHGKGNKARTVGIDSDSLAHLERWLAIRGPMALPPGSRLFCTLDGSPVSDRYVRALMPRLARDAGIAKRVHFHGLRHTHAAELASEGVPMNEIQQQLGHSNLAVTSKYLSHLNPAQTVDRMKGRSWTGKSAAGHVMPDAGGLQIAPPDWVDQIRNWIGSRLAVFHDGRRSTDDYKAIVLLID